MIRILMEEKLCDYRLPGAVVYYFTCAGGTSWEGSLLEIENKNLSKIMQCIPKQSCNCQEPTKSALALPLSWTYWTSQRELLYS